MLLRKLSRWVRSALAPYRSDEDVTAEYIRAGNIFGLSVSDVGSMGEHLAFEDDLDAFERAEEAYAAKGFRTLPIDDFVASGGWGHPLRGLSVRREPGEPAVYHGRYYRDHYLGRVSPAVDFTALIGGSLVEGSYTTPSTAHLCKHR
jgi:hypothetical protein